MVLIGIIVLFALAFLLGDRRSYFKKKNEEFDDDLNFQEIEIESINREQLEQLLQTARDQQNYKVGIRALYLLTIWQLGDKEIIAINEHKTNYDYSYEITNTQIRSIFEVITTTYDYIWYGEFDAVLKHFEKTELDYKKLTTLL